MEHEQHHPHPDQGYHDATGQWVDSSAHYPQSQHHSPVHDYNGFAYNPLPMEPMYSQGMSQGMPPPPPRTTHQQLQPLIMPQWPSMLTSQSNYAPPPMYSAPAPVPVSATPTPVSATSTRSSGTPRKTLTDNDRRRMCLYHEENPTVKQTEIGGESCCPVPRARARADVCLTSYVRRGTKVWTAAPLSRAPSLTSRVQHGVQGAAAEGEVFVSR